MHKVRGNNERIVKDMWNNRPSKGPMKSQPPKKADYYGHWKG